MQNIDETVHMHTRISLDIRTTVQETFVIIRDY